MLSCIYGTVWVCQVGMVWYGTIRYDIAMYVTVVQYFLVLYPTRRYGMVLYRMIRSGTTVHVLVAQYFVVEYQMRENAIRCPP